MWVLVPKLRSSLPRKTHLSPSVAISYQERRTFLLQLGLPRSPLLPAQGFNCCVVLLCVCVLACFEVL